MVGDDILVAAAVDLSDVLEDEGGHGCARISSTPTLGVRMIGAADKTPMAAARPALR
jgi:hypothetical protein